MQTGQSIDQEPGQASNLPKQIKRAQGQQNPETSKQSMLLQLALKGGVTWLEALPQS